MPSYEYEDLLGGNADPVTPQPLENPLDRAIRVLQALKTPQKPAAVVGNDLAAPKPPVTAPPPTETLNPLGPAPAPAAPAAPAPIPSGAQLAGGPYGSEENRPPDPARSVAEATQQVNNQTVRIAAVHAASERAKQEALRSHADAQVTASEDAVQEQTLLNTKHERTLEMISARADAESASKLHELTLLAKQEPNPARWWENQSGLGKALWALSLVFGAAHTALTPGAKNAALEMVRQEIANDMASQDARLKREMAIGELDYSAMKEKQARRRNDAMDKYSREYSKIQALERAWQARAVAPNDLDAQAGKMESQLYFEQLKLPLITAYRQELVDARTRAETQRFQMGMQASSQNFARDERIAREKFDAAQKALDRQQAYDLAQLSVSAKGPAFDSKGNLLNKEGLPALEKAQSGVGTNVVVIDPKTNKPQVTPYSNEPGTAVFREGKGRADFEESRTAADELYNDRVRLLRAMTAAGKVEAGMGIAVGVVDPDMEKLIKKVGMSTARYFNGSRPSDKDFSNAVKAQLGFDPDSGTLDRAKFATNWDSIRTGLENDIKNSTVEVSNRLSSLLDKNIGGDAKVLWQPPDLDAPKVQERSQNEVEGKPDVTSAQNPVAGRDDYLARRDKEDRDPALVGQQLPSHFRDQVDAVINAAEEVDKGRPTGRLRSSPEAIRAEAKRVLDDIAAQTKAIEDEQGDPQGPGHWRDLTRDEVLKLQRLSETKSIVEKVADDEVSRAIKKLKAVEEYVRSTPYLSTDSHRKNVARKFGFKSAPRDIEDIIKRVEAERE